MSNMFGVESNFRFRKEGQSHYPLITFGKLQEHLQILRAKHTNELKKTLFL